MTFHKRPYVHVCHTNSCSPFLPQLRQWKRISHPLERGPFTLIDMEWMWRVGQKDFCRRESTWSMQRQFPFLLIDFIPSEWPNLSQVAHLLFFLFWCLVQNFHFEQFHHNWLFTSTENYNWNYFLCSQQINDSLRATCKVFLLKKAFKMFFDSLPVICCLL